MRTIFYILQKELIQVFRNKTMLPIIFILPIAQLIILVNAANMEMKRIRLHVVDNDLSSTSRELVSKFEGAPFFEITGFSFSEKYADNQLLTENSDAVIIIPKGFERELTKGNNTALQIRINAINGMVAGLINGYSGQIIANYSLEKQKGKGGNSVKPGGVVDISYSFWYNPDLNYKIYMVPGMLVLLVTIIGMFLTAINIVREKEMGTIEQINVTPIKKYQFIIGKMIPFWIIAMFELVFGLIIGKLLFDIPIQGNLFVLFSIAGLYLIVALGFGLFISTTANTQQQVMFVSFFFLLLFILMSGLFTPTDSMPYWAQQVNVINPIAVFLEVVRMILLKGSGYSDLIPQIIHLTIYAVIIMSLAVMRYRKTGA
ncbi:MAG: ABC transporter permease [Bacteroidales bacterium]|nr:ABC transporter permease [Bacteroidales bacterium]